MTQLKHAKLTHEGQRNKAATTTAAANAIMDAERTASDAKVARLKAMRLAASPPPMTDVPHEPPARQMPHRESSAIRKIQLAD